jgi:TRAP transporter 4TM/12TM fusion protein
MGAILEIVKKYVIMVLVVTGTCFALYTGGTGPFPAPVQRGFMVLVLLPLVFLVAPSRLFRSQTLETAFSLFLGALTVFVMTWDLVNVERLYSDPFISDFDITLGLIGLGLVLEGVRRTVGSAILILLLLALVYAFVGPWIPIDQLKHGGLDIEILVSQIFYGTDGVFTAPIGVVSTFIIVIIMLGAVLTNSGGAELFMNLAKIVAGRFIGGPAKIAVIGSAMMGMITGATVANVATTGTVTIPMMMRAGYRPTFAAAVEALASSGGQLMPPIMGAAAFIMIDFLNLSYTSLMYYAIVPALVYFFSVLMIVHVRSVKNGFQAIPATEIPRFGDEMKARGHMILPIVVLVVLLANRFGIMYVAYFAVVGSLVIAMFRPETRLDLRGLYKVAHDAMVAMVPLVAICAGAGILIGVLTATGLNMRITLLIEYIAQGNLFITLILTMIACIILGMGLPTVAAYVVLAILVPASLTNLGVNIIAAHLFIFYFAILSAITPPVCTGAYVAAGIAKCNPVKTGFVAIRLGLVVFLLPFAFVYDTSLLLIGEWSRILVSVGTCVLGCWLWAIGLEGYLKTLVPMVLRGCFIVAGAMLIWTDLVISASGFALGAVSLVMMFLRNRRLDAQSPAKASA